MSIEVKSSVFIRFELAGVHQWNHCDLDQVMYLKDLHRHKFFFELHKQVFHDDRDVEFICFQYDVKQYLIQKYFSDEIKCLNFQTRSCEMIAKELLLHFNCEKVIVSEDNENGAIIEKA